MKTMQWIAYYLIASGLGGLVLYVIYPTAPITATINYIFFPEVIVSLGISLAYASASSLSIQVAATIFLVVPGIVLLIEQKKDRSD